MPCLKICFFIFLVKVIGLVLGIEEGKVGVLRTMIEVGMVC